MPSERVPLADYTTLRLGGPAARLTEARSADEVVASVRAADAVSEPLLVLGGGSNLVVSDDGFPGTVLRIATTGVAVREAGDQVLITVAAGENWDQFVEWSVSEKLAGIECLAGIPGLAGATPIQNVGAYGQEVAATITSVTVFDRAAGSVAALAGRECGFGYRTSVFKQTGWPLSRHAAGRGPTGRYVVLDVTFALVRDPMSDPVRYSQLAEALGIDLGDRAPLADVTSAVLQLRRSKGMVLDPADPDTVSAGSFFTNPVLGADQFAALKRTAAATRPGERIPVFPADDGLVKVSAAWLIELAGFDKGYPGDGAAARISSKHTLALTNAGGASTADLVGLARQIVAGVRSEFGIELAHEPVLVGVTL